MKLLKITTLLFLVLCGGILTTQAQKKPTITISKERVSIYGYVQIRGLGFTAKKNASSHLRKPDGSEYPVLPILTDAQGEFIHDIDTLLLPNGVHELWVVDDEARVSSNLVRFEVTTEQ
jgi:hypothetical protein